MGKSSYHRSENTYKFQSFSERIASVNVDVIHTVRHVDDKPEENSTYFGEALEKWIDLNCTQHFDDFRREISEQVQTFAQLVHHEEAIITALKKHLQVPDSMAFEPLLDLLVQLARDLQMDFYKYFQDFFDLLVKLLDKYPQDAELLEKLFCCLSYLFKFLWRYMVRDIKDVYRFFSTLLSGQYKEYIRNFAAESFAFLMRKVKDHGELFDYMFLSLQENNDTAEGVGRLMFEMMKGVKKQFHSCTEKVFPVLLSKAGHSQEVKKVKELPWELVEQSLSHTFLSIAQHTDREHSSVVWTVLLDSVKAVHKKWGKSPNKAKGKIGNHLNRLLRLTNSWLTYRQGYMVNSPDKIADVFLLLLKEKNFTEDIGQTILDVVSSLILSCHMQLSVQHTSRLVTNVFKVDYQPSLVYGFAKSLLSLAIFEKDVLPELLSYSQAAMKGNADNIQDINLQLFTEILLEKAPVPQDGSCLETYRVYPLDFSTKSGTGFQKFIVSIIDSGRKYDLSTDGDCAKIWSSLVCMSHVRPLSDVKRVYKHCEALYTELMAQILSDSTDSLTDQHLFLLHQLTFTSILLQTDEDIDIFITFDMIKQILLKHSSNINALRAADLYITRSTLDGSTDSLKEDNLLEIFPVLQENLLSCHTEVRFLTLRILSQFDVKMPAVEEEDAIERTSVFSKCLEAEKVPLTVQDYRQRLLYLQKLEFDIVQNSIPIGPYSQVVVRYLIGSLHVNFKLLWEPIRDLIASHAKGLDRQVFWQIYYSQLQQAANQTEAELKADLSDNREETTMDTDNELYNLFHQQCQNGRCQNTTPDFRKYRLQLWKAMQLFPEKVEAKSKDVCPLLFSFLQNEYYKTDLNAAPKQNILKQVMDRESETEVTEEDSSDEEEEEIAEVRTTRSMANKRNLSTQRKEGTDDNVKTTEEEEGENKKTNTKGKDNTDKGNDGGIKSPTTKSKKTRKQGLKKQRRATTSDLIVHLELFAKFKNPKSLYMEADLRNLYEELLTHRDTDVQKVAFKCLMTYKYTHLTPYRESFEKLLDDKTFRNEIVLFSIDNENSIVATDHRGQLLPVLMRVLYGKILQKTGNDNAGKTSAYARRSIVFRFLNGCTRQELCSFMEMVFAPLKYLITDDPYSMVTEVMNSLNLAEVFPLRRMSGALNTVDMIVKKLGHLLEDYLPNLFKIILGLLATIATCLERRKEITQMAINNLKNLRSLAINRLIQFFENFDEYDFTAVDIDAVFKVAVWPQIKKLPFEGIYHPTALLKLLHTWTKQKRLFVLLGKYENDDSKEDNLLMYTFQLLNAKDVDPSVTSLIIEIVENLLAPQESEEHVTASLSVNNSLIDINDQNKETDQSIGVTLLMSHVPAILQHLETFVASLKAHLNKKHGKCKELTILSRISEFVTDEAQCTTLISLLLPFLQKGIPRTQVIEQDILTSIYNLMKIVEDRYQFYRDICHLFAILELRQSRILLCNILNVVKEKKESIQDVCQLVTEMNSWNPKHMDEPDYMKRLDAYKRINETVKSMEDLNVDFLFPVIHNSCFFIRSINDMSIRDYSTHCLTTIIKQFGLVSFKQDVYRELISQSLLSEVKAGIRNKDETVRHEFITLLSTLVEVFPDHASFSDLVGLKDKDPETDFFENMKHIQIHRRGRALRKIMKYLDKHSVKQETMMSYFLPLTSSFINDETYSKQHDLQDAAIETLGYLCRRLPWNQYLHQLKHYLYLLPKRLQSQKLIVRVIVAVLDGFHFDLTHSEYRVTLTPVPKDKKPSQETGDATNDENKTDETVTDDDIVNPEEMEVSENITEDGQDTSINDTDQMAIGYVKCPANLATKIHTVIVKSILPQLHKALTQKAKSEGEHKLAKTTYAEDTEILRVPMALAMVKLIQNLPEGSLRHSLPGILIKVCNFLKSRAKDIRDIARDTLVKILMSLGPSYFPYILTEMRGTLQRGYQLHVLSYTVYILLMNMSSIIKPGDLDVCQAKLQEVFNEELFGNVAEEKEVQGITVKVFEAKTVKSYDSYQILSQYIGKKSLIPLITPLKQILDSTRSHQVAKKVQEVMKKITAGLIDNTYIDIETLLVFTHGLISETLPVISESKGEKEKTNDKDEKRKPESCLLLPATPKRGGDKPKAHKKTNIHILVEFGLQLLNMSLKKSRINQNDKKQLMMLDPFIEGLAECLFSKHVRINSVSLRCLSWLLKFSLPSLKTHIEKLANGMFILLQNYASAGAAKGDNLDLVTTAFKTVTVLVRDIKFHTIDNSQLQVLLTFCEEDLHDYKRQSTAFTLLKAILSRQLNIPEVHQLMTKVEGLSITADSPHVRRECRQVTLQYLLEYALGKKLVKHLEFYITQLSYEMEMGRESALEMLATVFSSFPQSVLMKHAGFFFIPMSAALVNDESAKCRKLTALAIKSLLEKIDHNTRNSLFSIAVKWFKDEKLRHQTLASQLCGLFVEVESGKFEHHLSEILPLIEQQLEPGKYEKINNQSYEQDADHLLYNTLNTLRKILQECNILRSAKWTENMNVIWEHIEKHLLHPHVWVRLVSAQLYGLLFMAWKPEDVIGSHDAQKQEYLQVGSYKKIEALAVLFCSQLQSQYLNDDLAGQVVKNMIFITKIAKCFHATTKLESERRTENDGEMEEENEESSDGQYWRRLSLPWLSRKMIREANHEAISTPKHTIKRSSVFKWMAAVSLDLGADILPTILHILLPCLQREISDQINTQDSTLKTLAQEVVEILKKIVGVEVFTKVYNEVQKSRAVRKGDRKRQRALEAVSNPDIAARRKIKKNLAKQEAKKRKLETFRTSKKIKKQRLQSMAVIDG